MAYSLIRECAILLVYNGVGYRFDALSDFDFSQTYSKSTNTRKTLHSRIAKQNTLVTSKNNPSFSMSVICTDTYIEGVFFDLLGMNKLATNSFQYQETDNIVPELCDIYVMTDYDTYKLSKAALQSLDIGLALKNVSSFEVSFTASSLDRVRSFPLSAGILQQGEPMKPDPIQFRYNNDLYNSIVNAGLAFQQSITWREDRSLHDIGKIYTRTKPILSGTNMTLNISTHLKSTITHSPDPELAEIELNKNFIYIKMNRVLVTKRITPEDIFLESYDVSLTEKSNTYVEYGGRKI